MAYLEAFISELIGTLRQAGYTACTEYELQTLPMPQDAQFVTAAVSKLSGDAPLASQNGTAVPMLLHLRFRIHGKVGSNPDLLTACWEQTLLPALLEAGYALTDIQLGETDYDKQLNRIVKEASASVTALLTQSDESEEA